MSRARARDQSACGRAISEVGDKRGIAKAGLLDLRKDALGDFAWGQRVTLLIRQSLPEPAHHCGHGGGGGEAGERAENTPDGKAGPGRSTNDGRASINTKMESTAAKA